DPRGIARAAWNNFTGGSRQGGSTITQQLAKFTFLNADRTFSRKAREMLIAWWMEAWLTKDEILGRYLSNAYFGDNVYGLRAASLHYFYRQPERLTISQATMLAGLLKAPSRLAPTRNLAGARARQQVVLLAMTDAGYLTVQQARAVPPAVIDSRARPTLPTGTYFADWAMPQARDVVDADYDSEARVITTLDARLQDIARRVTSRGDLGRAQVALVAMRPDGEVVAMIGGRSYADSPFNRATQARRQPGSTFKLAVYLAAMRAGMTPDTMVDGSAITTGDYRPTNYAGRYQPRISLADAFAQSSNVVAVRLYRQLGHDAVAQAAHDLGFTSAVAENASAALGSSGTTLLELTSAYAAVAANYGPVSPHALHQQELGYFARMFDGRNAMPSAVHANMLALLRGVIDHGTGRAARLSIPAYGKTGTTQDSRDALFIGFAGDLVVGIWVGNDDNSPLRGVTGGGLPAQIWRDFMGRAIPGAVPQRRRAPRPAPPPEQGIFDDLPIDLDIAPPTVRMDGAGGLAVDADVGGVGIT
ncbi:MAG: transglycosylase domain-containing protein, partial [Sphingopyxis sp.]